MWAEVVNKLDPCRRKIYYCLTCGFNITYLHFYSQHNSLFGKCSFSRKELYGHTGIDRHDNSVNSGRAWSNMGNDDRNLTVAG